MAKSSSSSKPRKSVKKKIQQKTESQNLSDIDTLKSDVASFASSLGLSSSSSLPTTTSGFNDSDFRKTGPLKPNKKAPAKPNQHDNSSKKPLHQNRSNFNNNNNNKKNVHNNKPKYPRRDQQPEVPAEFSNPDSTRFDKFKNLPKLPLMKASGLGVWYEDLAELEAKVIGEGQVLDVKSGEKWNEVVEMKRKLGERLMAQYTLDYVASEGKRGDIKMLLSTQNSGTSADKVSAYSVLTEENPIANKRSLDALLGMVTAHKGKRHAVMGLDALKELFISRLLPDRKLKSLLLRPVDNLPESKDGNSLLLLWYWEECLKLSFERFVGALEEGSRDILPILKDKSLKIMSTLLRSKSEQERRLLCALINKLGDPQNKGASNADFHLSNLLADHPNMKVEGYPGIRKAAVVIDEVDSFLFRPHLGLRSKYHAINFLNQIRLTHKGDDPKVAKRLIDIYFALFKVLISEASGGQKIDKRSKANDKKAFTSYKDSKDEHSSELYVEMDSRLLSALLTGVNRAFPFVPSNEADDVIEVQTPMLFQLVHSENFNVGIQALMLLDKLSSKNQIVSDRFYRALYSKVLFPAAMNSSKVEMFLGLLSRAMKSDVNLKRVSAFSKRLLQVALQQPPQYACACLFVLSEVLKARPPLWNMVLQNESNDDDLEHFEDIVEETENNPLNASKKLQSYTVDPDGAQDEHDMPNDRLVINNSQDFHGQKPQTSNLKSSLPGGYNPRHREPAFCNANHVSWWELMLLASHVHPSVATMAGTLLSGANIVYNGNPLNDLSLGAFLDKFMEKKPKQTAWHGASQIEPAKQLDMNHHLIGPEILSLAEVDVAPEDLVFHKFYANKMTSSKKLKKKKKKGAEDDAAEEIYGVGDGGDDSDNEEIDNMLDSTDPAVGTDGEYDYDDLDEVANEDDDDLVGGVSDGETDIPSDIDIAEGEDIDASADDDWSDDDEAINIGDADDGSDEDDKLNQRKRKRKSIRKTGESPFASLEEYEHLLNEDDAMEKEPTKKKPKSNKNGKKNKKSV